MIIFLIVGLVFFVGAGTYINIHGKALSGGMALAMLVAFAGLFFFGVWVGDVLSL